MRIAVIPGDGIGMERRPKRSRCSGRSARSSAGSSISRCCRGAPIISCRPASRSRRTATRCCATSSTPSSSARSAIRACPTTATRATSCSARASSSISTSTTGRCSCSTTRLCPLKDRDDRGRQLRRLSREHRGRLRQHRRPLQGRHRRRGRDPGRDQHLQGCAPHHPARLRVRAGRTAAAASAWPTRATRWRRGTRCGSASSRRSRRSIPASRPRHLYIDALAMLLVQDPGAVRGHRHQQPVRRHHHRPRRGAAGRPRPGGVRQPASGQDVDVRAGARIGAAAGGEERREPDGRDPVGRADARDLGLKPEARAIEAAVQEAVVSGQGTTDIGGSLGTRETGDYIASAIR